MPLRITYSVRCTQDKYAYKGLGLVKFVVQYANRKVWSDFDTRQLTEEWVFPDGWEWDGRPPQGDVPIEQEPHFSVNRDGKLIVLRPELELSTEVRFPRSHTEDSSSNSSD